MWPSGPRPRSRGFVPGFESMSLTILAQDLSLALLRGFEVDSKFLLHLFRVFIPRVEVHGSNPGCYARAVAPWCQQPSPRMTSPSCYGL